jgi:hypothetical protein
VATSRKDILKVLSHNLLPGTEEDYRNFRPRVEPGTYARGKGNVNHSIAMPAVA